MKQRCENPNATSYSQYGQRGIAVCRRWQRFDDFLADMGECPSKLHSIDRIYTAGDYEPSNCRWATRLEQSRNKTSTRLIELNGNVLTLPEAALACGVSYGTIVQRIRKLKWPVSMALCVGVDQQQRRPQIAQEAL
jgi:hypothetical protein